MQRSAAPANAESPREELIREVRDGLSRPGQKILPSKLLYDRGGSYLFEAITRLPEYGLTRADERVLAKLSPTLPELLPGRVCVAELGSGSGAKTRSILKALANGNPVAYHPIDVSTAALEACRVQLEGLCRMHAHRSSYIEGLSEVVSERDDTSRLLLLFLGSTIGNFSSHEALNFLSAIRRQMRSGDALLLGADLVKPVDTLLFAYNDPAGVTAAFNKNVLGRMNRELGANFDLSSFEHEARYSGETQAVEMHLRSTRSQEVTIPGAGLAVSFEEGETIWTESSRKFTLRELDELALKSGFKPCRQWTDSEWPFAECLWLVA